MPSRSSRLRPHPRLGIALAAAGVAFLVCFLVSSRAHAADITIAQKDSLPRVDSGGNAVSKRDTNLKPEGVSYQDCIDNQGIRFTLTLPTAPEANASLEAWGSLSGADCSAETARTVAGSSVCWRILQGIPLSTNPVATLPVRKIIGGRNNGKITTAASEEGLGDEKLAGVGVCGTIDLSSITVQFLYFAPGNRATALHKGEAKIDADTIGPVAPSGLTILPGDTRLSISFNALGEGGVVELSTIKAYCDPSPGAAAKTTPSTTTRVCDAAVAADADPDAAVDPDAGCKDVVVDGTSTPAVACSSTAFTAGDSGTILPDLAFNAKYECGSLPVSSTGSTIIAKELAGAPLQNGKTYAVALAASDSFLNVGPLSSVVCEFPEPTHDFWQDYKNGGGGAGGGFCSIEGPGVPVGSFTLIGMAAALGASVWRRKSRARRNGR